jgi:peroxiredoxin Q/BCP
MKKLLFVLLASQCTFSLAVFSQGGGGVKNGLAAPDFTAKDQDGNTVSLSQYKGKKVVLYFYPKDDTPGCTAEACSIRDNYDSLTKAGYTILGVSTDNERSHKDFKAKYKLPFTLIADTDTSITKAYLVWVNKEKNGQKFWGTERRTYIIDERGIVVNSYADIDPKEHVQKVLSYEPVEKIGALKTD